MDGTTQNVVCVQCGSTLDYCFDGMHSVVELSSNGGMFCTKCGARLMKPASFSIKKSKPPTEDEAKRIFEELIGQILAKHHDLVKKFLEITERKVAVLDEYGDESWDALPDEIDRCVAKIGKRGQPEFRTDKQKWPSPRLRHLPPYFVDKCALKLSLVLNEKFREYHQNLKAVPAIGQDFSALTGVDFEVYVAKLLREAGFEDVAGTSVTGDQGADLIVKHNGKTIAIQVKGYAGPVGNGAVQETVSALKFYKADEAWVVTNSSFTPAARSLAQANTVRLIDGHDLKDFVHIARKT